MTESRVELGRVRSANARSREVRVTVKTGYAYVFEDLPWIRFQAGRDESLRCKVLRSRMDGDTAIVALSPGVSRDTVGQLRGARVELAASEMPPKPGWQFRLDDLIDLRVVTPDGQALGHVAEVYEGPANDAFAIEGPDGRRLILPLIEAVVLSLDLDERELHVGDIAPYVVEE